MSSKFENGRNRRSKSDSVDAGVELIDMPGVVADREEEEEDCRTRRSEDFSSPICVSVDKVYDACRERNCIVDSRVFVRECDQDIIDKAINVKLKDADIIWVYTDIDFSKYNNR